MQHRHQTPSAWIAFLAHLLFVLAAWSVFIKYIFPITFALFWDLWPVAHVWLGWAPLAQPFYTRWLAVGMSVVEIIIIVTLFAGFLAEPEWSIWRTNWFVNKVFVLTAFMLILGTVIVRPERFRTRSS